MASAADVFVTNDGGLRYSGHHGLRSGPGARHLQPAPPSRHRFVEVVAAAEWAQREWDAGEGRAAADPPRRRLTPGSKAVEDPA